MFFITKPKFRVLFYQTTGEACTQQLTHRINIHDQELEGYRKVDLKITDWLALNIM